MVDSSHMEVCIWPLYAHWFPSDKKSVFAIHPYISPAVKHIHVFNISLSLQFSGK